MAEIDKDKMKVKPIEASPQLSVEDSKKIIKEVNTKPRYKRGQKKKELMGKNDKTFLKTWFFQQIHDNKAIFIWLPLDDLCNIQRKWYYKFENC